MTLQNYQLVKEEDWYYLSRKRITTHSYVNALALSSELSKLSHCNGPVVPVPGTTLSPRDKVFTPKSDLIRSDVGEMSDVKSMKGLSPLVINAKEKVFDNDYESVGHSSPLTVKSDQPDHKSYSQESSVGADKKITLSKNNMSVEDVKLSLINRRRSKEIESKMVKDPVLVVNVERSKSEELGEGDDLVDKNSLKAVENEEKVSNVGPEIEEMNQQSESAVRCLIDQKERESATEIDDKTGTESEIINLDDNRESLVSPFTPESEASCQLKTTPLVDSTEDTLGLDSKVIDSTPTARPGESGHRKILQKRVSLDSPESLQEEAMRHFSSGNVGGSFSQIGPLARDFGVSSLPSTPSQVTSSAISPLVTDISIQLIKSDGRCEAFQASPERDLQSEIHFVNDDYSGSLKRCSSFAGFRSKESCEAVKAEDVSVSQTQSPVKPTGPISRITGRYRHFSAPLSGHGTPKSRVSTLPQTPSYDSSRCSFTEDGTCKLTLYHRKILEICQTSLCYNTGKNECFQGYTGIRLSVHLTVCPLGMGSISYFSN